MKPPPFDAKIGMMTMGDKVFADTNIVLRAFHSDFPEHEQIKTQFDRLITDQTNIFISRQVIREYLVQVTHPRTFTTPLTIEEAEKHLGQITRVCAVLDDTATVTAHLLTLLKTYPTGGKQVHDANIVATMLAFEIDTLLTLNTEDFQRFADKITLISPPKSDKL